MMFNGNYRFVQLICLLSAIGPTICSFGQNSQKDVASDVAQYDSLIRNSETQWNVTTFTPARADINVAKEIAGARALSLQRGDSSITVKSSEDWAKNYYSQLKLGAKQEGRLKILSDGELILAQIEWRPVNQESSPVIGKNIDFYNGELSVEVNSGNKNKFSQGSIRRGKSPGLLYTLPHFGLRQLLAGDAVTKITSVAEKNVKFNADGSILVEKTLQAPQDSKKRSEGGLQGMIARILLSPKKNRIRRIDFYSPFSKRNVFYIESQGIKPVSGIDFPSRVVVGSNVPGSATTIYELVSARFNDEVDVSTLRKPIAVGTFINDERFSPRPPVRYKIRKGGIPGDATVLKLVEQREENEKAEKSQQRSSTTRNFALPAGALVMIVGLIWFRRSRRDAA